MIKKYILFLFLTFLYCYSTAQKFSIYSNSISEESIFGDLNTCTYESKEPCKNPSNISDHFKNYFYLPNGDFVKISTKLILDSTFIEFYKVNENDCNQELISMLRFSSNDKYIPISQFAVSDYLGRIYFVLLDSDTNKRILSRINSVYDQKIDLLFEVENIEDLFIIKNKYYINDPQNNKIIIYDENFNKIDEIVNLKYLTVSFFAISKDCENTDLYAFHCSVPYSFDLVFCSDTIFISKFNLKDKSYSPVCAIKMKGNDWSANVSSPLEFLASDPECDLLLDLDRDNSSGLYPYDYQNKKSSCTENTIFLADSDAYIHTSSALDSIKITLQGILDRGSEILSAASGISPLSLVKRNDSTYVLIGPGNLADSIWLKAIKNIVYTNNHLTRSAGERKIEWQGYNRVKTGVKIYSHIYLGSGIKPNTHDTTITVCGDKKITNLNTLVGGSGGKWIPRLQSGTDEYNSTVDLLSRYDYISGDSICELDTASVFIRRGIALQVQRTFLDTLICKGNSITILNQTIRDTGTYVYTIPNVVGCDSVVFTLNLGFALRRLPLLLKDRELCGAEPVMLTIDSVFNTYRWSNTADSILSTSNKLIITRPGSYKIRAIDRYQCSYTDSLNIVAYPLPKIMAKDMIEIDFIKDRPITISYTGTISKYTWSPKEGLSCSECAVPGLTDQINRKYFIKIVSDKNCMVQDSVSVSYKSLKFFIPNIIVLKPGNENDRFFIRSSKAFAYDLEIFDRWGHIVYAYKNMITNDASVGWSPALTRSPQAVYVYKAIIHTDGGAVLKAGDITVIR